MQYELKTHVIEQTRHTFDHLVRRFGDKPASRYLEGTVDVQATENFHYRPQWDPTKEIYDESFSDFRLTDPYSFLDPRQYYYAPYVTSRAAMHDAFGATLDYLEGRGLLDRLPEEWKTLVARLLLPMRHYESGAQLISCHIARFGFGTSITQCAAYAAFDRTGNAQQLSRLGIALGGGGAEILAEAKTSWMEDEALQGLRRYVEENITEPDWGVGLVWLDAMDRLLFHLLFTHLDDAAIAGGAPAYSLCAQHFVQWFGDQRRWVDGLYRAWAADPEKGRDNAGLLVHHVTGAVESSVAALRPFAEAVDGLVGSSAVTALEEKATEISAPHVAPTA